MSRTLLILVFIHFFYGSAFAQELNNQNNAGNAMYVELGGKGFFSFNADFRINDKHRFSVGVTSLDYDVLSKDNKNDIVAKNWFSPGIMYYYLPGQGANRFELGAGISISPNLNHTYDSDIHSDSPISLHGVIGYRRQVKESFFFRAGATPFYRPKVWFLPLIGLSFGYSW